MFTEFRSWLRPSEERRAGGGPNGQPTDPRRSLCYVLDEDADSSQSLAGVLHDSGIEAGLFERSTEFADGMARRTPDLVFLDVTPEAKQAIDAVFILGERYYHGPVQLMGGEAIRVMDTVKNMGERHSLNMLPAMRKPLKPTSVRQVLQNQGLDRGSVAPVKVDLAEALRNRWIEFWYQPKIDLAKKQIAGVETFPRVRHPEHGLLPPEAFAPEADEASLAQLTERALIAALTASADFTALGINLPLAINISVNALADLPIRELVRQHTAGNPNWPGLIIDVTEEQIAADAAFVGVAARRLAGCNIRLAVDDFGSNRLPLNRLRDLPLAEIKIDRSIVANTANERARASACKTIVELAHSLSCAAVAIGVERAADVHMLRGVGCDLGQGFLFGQPMPEDRLLALLRERSVIPRRAEPAQRARSA
jgi:EAL domain-containing protein (putative c-di-GMP-specific phosphodiesterase class I)